MEQWDKEEKTSFAFNLHLKSWFATNRALFDKIISMNILTYENVKAIIKNNLENNIELCKLVINEIKDPEFRLKTFERLVKYNASELINFVLEKPDFLNSQDLYYGFIIALRYNAVNSMNALVENNILDTMEHGSLNQEGIDSFLSKNHDVILKEYPTLQTKLEAFSLELPAERIYCRK